MTTCLDKTPKLPLLSTIIIIKMIKITIKISILIIERAMDKLQCTIIKNNDNHNTNNLIQNGNLIIMHHDNVNIYN